MEVGLYPGLRSVVVYPGAMRPKIVGAATGGIGISSDERPTPVLGQSWRHGVVVLSWDSARQGAFDPRDGRNVVFHEFAHQLDQETGEADGTPVGVPLSSLKPWAEVLERRFGILKKATRRGSRTVMDSYGATNKAEFFAVATETFFEKPRKLREKQPDLYHRLTEFFRMDPAEGYDR
jgi:Mlc titration factor MtfA (ptsG expression regulator)